MTVSSTNRKSGPYTCDGSTVSFPFDFVVFNQSDVRVVQTNLSGLETDLTLGSNYSVSINPDQDNYPGGTVTTNTAYASGYLITITSDVSPLQAVQITNLGGFYPAVINAALDKLTILVQQALEQISRTVKVNISSTITPDQLLSQIDKSVSAAADSASASALSASTSAGYATNSANSAAFAAASASAASNTPVAAPTHAASSKTTPVDADEFPLVDSAALWVLKKITWANIKAALKTYFDTLYNFVTVTNAASDPTFADSSSNAASTNWAKGVAIGYNQTWQNVTASRALNTIYTNSTNKPIFVAVNNNQGAAGVIFANINGGQFNGSGYPSAGAGTTSIFFIVPPGGTYLVNGSGSPTLATWYELRS